MAKTTKDVRRDYLRPEKYLTIEEVQQLRQFVKDQADRVRNRGSTRALMDELIVELLIQTGLRSEELCHLILRDLPTFHGKDSVLVRKKKGHEPRVILVNPSLRKKLRAFIKRCRPGAKPGSPLFACERGHRLLMTRIKRKRKLVIVKEHTTRMSYQTLYRKIKRIAREAKIPHLTPHTLRHTFGSYLYSTERDISVVSKQLGHKSLSSTQIYVGVADDSVRQQMQKLERMFDDFR